MRAPTYALPQPVRLAALLVVAYGVMVVANALVLQSSAGWQGANEFPRALLRLAGCGLIAYGLMQARSWAWWVAVVLGALWALMGAAAVVMLSAADAWERTGSGAAPVFMVGMVLILGAAVGLLLRPASREAFR
ncbi:MAG TPA: hypothetical protein VHG93_28845 [Longimicrobium sp.]|nr:hypothetical protein [Longimicrobium sp.]